MDAKLTNLKTLFKNISFFPKLLRLAPKGTRRMGDNLMPTEAYCSKTLRMPHFTDYAVTVPQPGQVTAESTRVMGALLRDVMKLNLEEANFRVFGPDEIASNRLGNLLRSLTALGWTPQFRR
jgi:xylulose-5-phosphate/fructose-6-phosphate phosphoketolase